MMTKIFVTIGLVVLAWAAFTRLAGTRGARSVESTKSEVRRMQETVRCKACGIYLPKGETCSCGDRA